MLIGSRKLLSVRVSMLPSQIRPLADLKTHTEWPSDPYKGLNFFSLDDAPLFSQRDREVEDCAARLDDFSVRVLLLHGFSGMGKSSFLRAGLIPRLENPPEDGCRFHFLRMGSGTPAIVRSTADPIGGIYEALTEVVRYDDKQIPSASRDRVSEILKSPPKHDRKAAADILLKALKVLTGEVSAILTLVIDQAEQVLVSPHPDFAAKNRRSAFFYFLEELCRRRLDLRTIVAFRTEYYGQFNNFFAIPPTVKISSAALPRSGVAQYYLEPITELERVANIILLPTSEAPVKGLFPATPRERYRFEFAPGVAETIATDVLALSGESSTLPIVQVVCKNLYERCADDGRKLVELRDYESIGYAKGALEYNIEFAIRKALQDLGHPEVSNTEIDRWRLVLCKLAGQQQVGAITSLILTEQKLINAAIVERVEAPAKQMLSALAEQSAPILRVLVSSSSKEPIYTLAHDCIAGALSRWLDKHGERLKADNENAKRLRRMHATYRRAIGVGATAVGVAALISAAASYYYLLKDRQESVMSLTLAAEQNSTGLRDRLLMLVDASKRSEAAPLKVWLKFWLGAESNQADRKLAETVLRAPIFGGTFPAALDLEGARFAYLLYPNSKGKGTLVSGVLPIKPSDPAPPEPIDNPVGVEVPLDGIVDASAPNLPRPPPAIGFVRAMLDGGIRSQLAIVVAPGNVLRAESGVSSDSGASAPRVGPARNTIAILPIKSEAIGETGVVKTANITVGDFGAHFSFPPQIDFGNNSIRVTGMSFSGGGLPLTLSILPFRLSTSTGGDFILKPMLGDNENPKPFEIDWQPTKRAARRIPSLASDCDKFIFLGAPTPVIAPTKIDNDSQLITPILYVGDFAGQAVPKQLNSRLSSGTQQLSSVAIASGCSAALVHLSPAVGTSNSVADQNQIHDKLIAFNLKDATIDAPSGQEFDVPLGLKGFQLPLFPLYWPALTGARLENSDRMRVAWLVERGLAVVDLQDGGQASGLLPGDRLFLTGLPFTQSNTRLNISRNGNFLMLSQQKTYTATPDIRIFDLRIFERAEMLGKLGGGAALRQAACAIANFLPGTNQLSSDDLKALLRDADAEQPCQKSIDGKYL
jgi:hypothetical protein